MSILLRRQWQWYERGNVFSELLGPIPRDAFHTKEFSDLRIVTSDGNLEAHRIVLAAASPLIRHSLASVEAANLNEWCVIMPDYTHDQVESALRLFYGIAAEDECDLETVREFILPAATAADLVVKGEPQGKRRRRGSKKIRRQYACPEPACRFSTPTVKTLHAHSGIAHRVITCNLCEERVAFEDMSRHLEDLHGGRGQDSEKGPLTHSRTIPHPITPNAGGGYPCPQDDCEAFEKSLAAIKSHYRAHTSVLCDVCGKSVLKHNIKNHKARHTGNAAIEECKVACKHCGSVFSDNHALQVHLRVKHDEGDLEFKCDLCRACFVRKAAFAAHVVKCRLKDSVKIRRCIKKPVDPNSEYSKFKVPVDPNNPWKCPVPECNYEDARFLKRHYLDKHVTKACPHCNKIYT